MSVAAAAWTVIASAITAGAQTTERRVDVGGLMHGLRLDDTGDVNVGLGGRLAFDVTRWLSVEGEYQFTPRDELMLTASSPDGQVAGLRYVRRRSTALLGVKAGYRGARAGVFAKVRPGFTSLGDRGVDCLGDVCALMLLAVPEYRTEFAIDAGAVVEFYPGARWVVRGDVGSLVVRHRSTAPPCVAGGCTTSNLALSAGVGIRF